MGWQPMETAPKDGTEIIVRRHNDVRHEYVLVRWVGDDTDTYPWRSDDNAYPEGRLDEWHAIPR